MSEQTTLDLIRRTGMQELPATWVPGKHEDLDLYPGKELRFIDHDGNVFWIPLHAVIPVEPVKPRGPEDWPPVIWTPRPWHVRLGDSLKVGVGQTLIVAGYLATLILGLFAIMVIANLGR